MENENRSKTHVVITVMMAMIVLVWALISANGGYSSDSQEATGFGESFVFGLLAITVWNVVVWWLSKRWLIPLPLVWLLYVVQGITEGEWGYAASGANQTAFILGIVVLVVGAATKTMGFYTKHDEIDRKSGANRQIIRERFYLGFRAILRRLGHWA